MEQKMKWIGYLQLGISLVFVFLFSSCKKTITSKADWIYINETNHEIVMFTAPILSGDTLELKPFSKDTIVGKINYSDLKITDFTPPWVFRVKYNNVKCDTINFDEEMRVLSNFEAEELGDNYYQYTYRITETDYERAIDCE